MNKEPLAPRPYQVAALDAIRFKYASGTKKVLLWLPTGSGKTFVFCRVLDGVMRRARKAIMVVRGAALVDQASQRLFREGVAHGCLQASHWNINPAASIQVCSVDTLYRRKLAPPADLIVIDEAHLATSESFLWLFAQYPDAFYLPVTATPFVRKGLRHIADDVVHPITFAELIEQGWLSKPRYFAPTRLDLSEARIDSKTDDYKTADVAEIMDGNARIYGDMIDNYKEKIAGGPAVLFAIDVKHSLRIRDRFRDAGIRAEHLEADTPASERKRVLADLETGACQVVTNVGILTTGVDIPCLRGVILARATCSYNLYVQMIGRGTRVTPDKNSFIVLDHANNIATHGFVEHEPALELDGKEARQCGDERPCQCEECYGCFFPAQEWAQANPGAKPGRLYICPYCGHDNATARKAYERKKEEDLRCALREIEPPKKPVSPAVEKIIARALDRGYRSGWVRHMLIEKYGEADGKAHWETVRGRFADAR